MSERERLNAIMAEVEKEVPGTDPRDIKDERPAVNTVMNLIEGGADEAETFFLMGYITHMKVSGSGNDAA